MFLLLCIGVASLCVGGVRMVYAVRRCTSIRRRIGWLVGGWLLISLFIFLTGILSYADRGDEALRSVSVPSLMLASILLGVCITVLCWCHARSSPKK